MPRSAADLSVLTSEARSILTRAFDDGIARPEDVDADACEFLDRCPSFVQVLAVRKFANALRDRGHGIGNKSAYLVNIVRNVLRDHDMCAAFVIEPHHHRRHDSRRDTCKRKSKRKRSLSRNRSPSRSRSRSCHDVRENRVGRYIVRHDGEDVTVRIDAAPTPTTGTLTATPTTPPTTVAPLAAPPPVPSAPPVPPVLSVPPVPLPPLTLAAIVGRGPGLGDGGGGLGDGGNGLGLGDGLGDGGLGDGSLGGFGGGLADFGGFGGGLADFGGFGGGLADFGFPGSGIGGVRGTEIGPGPVASPELILQTLTMHHAALMAAAAATAAQRRRS